MAENRINQYLESIADGEAGPNGPRTRDEAMLAKIAAGEEITEDDRTRFQYWLKKIKPSGGDNPNYDEDILGTVGSPFGDYTFEQLHSAIREEEVSAFITVDATMVGLGVIGPFYLYAKFDDFIYFITAAFSGNDIDDVSAFYGQYSFDGTFSGKMLTYGAITPIETGSLFESLSTVVHLIHHPMPEETI